ncbi:hypothetical protein KU406_23930, partial [Salmonella enterica subsp. enterica serovar Montevideo]|nr:hypothetical protein [Salmonella enterica subsp. enterica serovar Montevideo]
ISGKPGTSSSTLAAMAIVGVWLKAGRVSISPEIVVATKAVMQEEQSIQRAVTRLCIQCGLFLLQHGAESALVDELSTRLGLA